MSKFEIGNRVYHEENGFGTVVAVFNRGATVYWDDTAILGSYDDGALMLKSAWENVRKFANIKKTLEAAVTEEWRSAECNKTIGCINCPLFIRGSGHISSCVISHIQEALERIEEMSK